MNKPSFKDQYDAQAKLLYGLIVAGKSANFADKCMKRLVDLLMLATFNCDILGKKTLFDRLRLLNERQLFALFKKAGTGNYNKLVKAVQWVLRHEPDLFKCSPADLETIPGIGPKTSRFVIMWIRPKERFAALDVHVLRWMRERPQFFGQVPKSTPHGQEYNRLEKLFIAYADSAQKTPRELDYEIWTNGAGRTQETPLPK